MKAEMKKSNGMGAIGMVALLLFLSMLVYLDVSGQTPRGRKLRTR